MLQPHIAYSTTGNYLYVVNNDGMINRVDSSANSVPAMFNDGVRSGLYGITIVPNTGYAYLTNYNGTISIVNTSSNTITGTIGDLGGSIPTAISASATGNDA